MAKIFAITNQKGGVGKSTSAFCVGAGLARKGFRRRRNQVRERLVASPESGERLHGGAFR